MKGMGILSLSMVVGISHIHAKAPQANDGKWWLSLGKDQRVGFLSGYADCAIYDVKKPGLSHFSAINFEQNLSKYYSDHSDERNIDIESMLWKLWIGSTPIAYPPAGETYKNRHGFFDGDYWRQATPNHRLGFVQGYLYCQKVHSKPQGKFSNSPEWYVAQISNWYGIKINDAEEIDESKLDKKIADALIIFKDKKRDLEQKKQ